MNEKELKLLFCKALASGHIKGNDLIPTKEGKIRIIEEAHFRSFDLLIASISPSHEDIQIINDNLLVRTKLLQRFARSEKCKIDHVRFFPVELKSDEDNLDERLPKQMIDAVLTFGLSILVLDKNHSKKANKLRKLLPATIICYTGFEDYFEVISTFDRFISAGILTMNKTMLAKLLGGHSAKTYTRLVALQRIIEKIAFNQLFLEDSLSEKELQFLHALTEISLPSIRNNTLKKLKKESCSMRMTDYA
jgi:hypothetical protein